MIRPTRFGVAFLGLILLTLIGCVNYGLSLGYGLTFLLGGVWVMTASLATRAARTVQVTLIAPSQATAGQNATFTLSAQNSGPDALLGVAVESNQGQTRWDVMRVPAGQGGTLALPLAARVRGPLQLTQVRVYALDGLGLWRAMLPSAAVLAPDVVGVTVFPAPERPAPPAPERTAPGTAEGQGRTKGDEEFAGLRPFASGDSPRQVSWRHYARTGTLLTRETDSALGTARLLDWADTAAAGDTELRLSRLAAWVQELRQLGAPFALHLPEKTVPVGQGEGHIRTALTALALHAPLPAPASTRKAVAVVLDTGAMRFTLLALAFTLLPSALRQPAWLSVLIALLLGHSVARTLRPLGSLPIWLLGLTVGLAGVMLNSEYGTLLGRDAGTALLALLLSLKAAESRSKRDGHLLVALGLFMTSTHFFHSQGPIAALHTLLSAAVLLGAAARWAAPGQEAEAPARTLRRVAGLLALSVPVALLLFVLFPRPDRPLWQLPLGGQATTGLASEIRAGEYGALAQSSAVAFRADFQGEVPPPEQRYWRGPVYELFDGESWQQVRLNGRSPSIEPGGPTWTYTLTLEPSDTPWLLALDVPSSVPQGAFTTTAFQAVSMRISASRRRVALQSQSARLGRVEDEGRLRYDLSLPTGQNPRALALAQSWMGLPPGERVRSALNYLGSGGFTYTLSPPRLPVQGRIDAFLFGTKQGFCEHYASAFAVLMRAAGVPARIVGGYLGGEQNPDGGYLIVRQQDAHAWTEVWLAGQGWVRVDPTAVIAPARINAGLQTALTTPDSTAAPAPSLLQRLRLRVDAVQTRWNDLVVAYDGQQQQQLLERVGLGGVGSAPYLLLMPALLLLTLLPAFFLLRQRAAPPDPAARALHDLSLRLKLPLLPGETASAYAERARAQYPTLGPALEDVVRAYHAARYAPHHPDSLKTLQSALRNIRP